MGAVELTLIDAGNEAVVETFTDSGRIHVRESALKDALGWELKPEGLCFGDVCVPIHDRSAIESERGLDLVSVAKALGRPITVDLDERVAAIGTSAADRTATMQSLEAPDFALPDLSGGTHRLSDHRGKKVLLIAYASW